jgi:hypothetical protein
VTKDAQGGVGNNSRKPRDLTKTRHDDSLAKSQLTLSQQMIKKGYEIAVDSLHISDR